MIPQKSRRAVPANDARATLAARIALLRRQRGLTLDQLASATGLTKSYLSKLERGLSVPSISTAMSLAESFALSVGQLLGEEESFDVLSIVRRLERPSFMRRGSPSGYDYELLAGSKRFKSMEPYIMRPPLAFEDERRFKHTGQEMIFVISGEIEFEHGSERHRLCAGDCAYFDAHLPHRSRSIGTEIAEALVVVTTEPDRLPKQAAG